MMVNYEGIAKLAADYLADKISERILDEDYSTINKAEITIDRENQILIIKTERKDPLGIPYYATTEKSLPDNTRTPPIKEE